MLLFTAAVRTQWLFITVLYSIYHVINTRAEIEAAEI